ncbi:MAG: type IV pilus secretin PilQ [Deltaproteobacteria bacterium]|nr:type IV pilus secretin PilQ [Deltaproteobacteria bacterium]
MNIFDNRLSHGLCGLVLASLLVFSGCASPGPKDIKSASETKQEAKEAAPEKKQDKISVEYINVVGDGDRIMIGTTGPTRYTVFKLTEPSRLIVDMPGVNLSKVASSIEVNNDFLNEISSISYGEDQDIGRIIIGIKEGVDHDVKSGENSILVSLKKPGVAAAEPKGEVVNASVSDAVKAEPLADKAAAPTLPPAAEPAQAAEAPAATQVAAAATEVQKAAATEAPVPTKPAKRILKVESSTEGENTVLKITTDGLPGNLNSFDLTTPSRIVVDIWGVDNAVGKNVVKVKDKYLKDVRIGGHKDKSRLVLDLTGKTVLPHSIKKVSDTVVVTIGPNVVAEKEETPPPVNTKYAAAAEKAQVAHVTPAVEAAAPKQAKAEVAPPEVKAPVKEAPKEAAKEVAPAEPAVRVDRVDFRKVNGVGRLTISSSAKAEYSVKESQDGMTLVVDLKGATISDELSRTLDAAKLKTPVASISSYQESVMPAAVRVLVKLSDKTPYEVKEENGSISVEFAAPHAAESAPSAEVKKAVAEQKGYTGKKIDLDMMDANVTDVLRLLAEVSNLNIIASDDIKGTISLRLKNVPWDQAFDIILKSKDLDSVREGNVIRVAPAAKIRQEKEAFLASRKAQEKLENLEVKFIPVNYATAADLEKQVKGVLTERGSVTSDARTNTLIVNDVRLGIASADNLIKKLDTRVPQVLIEARIVEATSTFARDLGIQWGADFQTGGHVSTNTFGSTTVVGQTPPTHTSPAFVTRSGSQDFAVNLPATGTAGTLGALGFVLGKAGNNPLILDLRLSAGESEGRLKTISRPRITTMDNKEAKIQQGESIPFETTSSAGTSTIFIDANLSLTVTPHITPDGSVLMKIKASRNSIGSFRTSSGQPSINKKESTTDVLVKDGETTVIGGIVISDKNDIDKGIPLLKDIPVLGWLFKNKSVSDSQQELLIFITPTIVKDKIVG